MKDNENSLKILGNLKEKFLLASQRDFVFLLVGRTGVGKSSTVNSLMGKEVTQVGDYEPTTMEVKEYQAELGGIQFTVVDTPGLCDDFEAEGNDYKYLSLMREKVKQIDSMWFVSRLDETRVTSDEKRGIKLISEAFGPEVWNHAIIVFTFSNNVDPLKFEDAFQKRSELIRKEIKKYSQAQIAMDVSSVAVDNFKDTNPDGEMWLGELYTKVFARISDCGALPFLLATAEFVKPKEYAPEAEKYNKSEKKANKADKKHKKPRIKLNKRQKKEIRKKINASIIPGLAVVGGTAGAALGPVGAAVGAAIGAAAGLVAWLFS